MSLKHYREMACDLCGTTLFDEDPRQKWTAFSFFSQTEDRDSYADGWARLAVRGEESRVVDLCPLCVAAVLARGARPS